MAVQAGWPSSCPPTRVLPTQLAEQSAGVVVVVVVVVVVGAAVGAEVGAAVGAAVVVGADVVVVVVGAAVVVVSKTVPQSPDMSSDTPPLETNCRQPPAACVGWLKVQVHVWASWWHLND